MQKLFKQYGIIIVAAFFVLVIALLCVVGAMSISKYKGNVLERDTQIKNLESSLLNIGDIQTGYVVKKAVRAGEKITVEAIQEVDVPVKLGLNIATGKKELIDSYFRISLAEGTVITREDVIKQKMDNTYRYFDLVIDESPIGVKAGEYLDIRITFSFGEDFIAISHKKVEEINSGIMKVVLNESEIYAYQSMLIDKAMYPGTKIYAVKYFDGGAQPTAEVYYPLNTNLAELSALNPNLLELVKQEMIAKRTQIDNLMGGGVKTKDEKELEKITGLIQDTRELINKSILQSQKALDKRLETEKKAAQQANK